MTDYLEEHLGNAEALLAQVRKLEQSISGLSPRIDAEENMSNHGNFLEYEQEMAQKNELTPKTGKSVYNRRGIVDQIVRSVYKPDIDPETSETPKILEKKQDTSVNYHFAEDYNRQGLGQIGKTSEKAEQETKFHMAQTENRSPISEQMEELDRALFRLPALLPGRREIAQGPWSADGSAENWPVSLSGPRGLAADLNMTSMPGGDRSGTYLATREDSDHVGMQSWAEQTDRIFRRDSRRYDGGFALY